MHVLALTALVAASFLPSGGAEVRSATMTIAGRPVTYVIAPLERVRIRVALGQDRPGRTETLGHIASRYRAIAAINGGYFEAYTSGAIKNLIETTIVDGSLVFKGDVGDTLYFDRYNRAAIEHVPLRIEGALDGSYAYPNNWYAYWFNRQPGPNADTITIFTPQWGERTGLNGFQVQVDDGIVTAISTASLAIPINGYVIYFKGETTVAGHFRIGRRVQYRIVRTDGDAVSDFFDAWQAVSGGPRLLTDGKITIDPHGEHFHDPKVWGNDARSMIGTSEDGRSLILAVSRGTLADCARIMQRLGAYQAMNLDSNASSGLWFRGSYLREPGRPLNNALLILAPTEAL